MTLLRMRGITKSFGANHVLQQVDLDLEAGEVLGLVGENGAGKSTLIKILAGVYTPESGSIAIADKEVQLRSPAASIEEGIAVIYQELTMVPDLSVADNIFLGLSAFITTLATLAMARGLTLAYSNGQTIFGLPDAFNFLGGGDIFGIPMPVILTLIAFIIAHLVLSKTVFGHQVYAIGGNREAAHLAGIRVKRVELIVYIVAGLLAGFGGLLLTGRLTAALPTSATGLELNVIAAVVIGGASLFGGRGTMIGTFFGVLTIGVLSNGLDLLNVSPFWVQFTQGGVIFLAVHIDALGQRRRRANS